MTQTIPIPSETLASLCPDYEQVVNDAPHRAAGGAGSCPCHSAGRDQPRVCRELSLARRVQQELFPRILPNSDDWEFAATCRPARGVAGDYYDVFDVGAGQIAVALGDVSGKGLGPSLVMAGVRAMIRSRLSDNTADLAGVMRELNQYLESTTLEEMFVTLFLAMLDRRSGALRFVNAGHPPPILVGQQVREPKRLTEGGIVLGIAPEARYDEQEVGLDPGSLVALYSDGITEASNGNGQRFEEPRLLHVLRRSNSAPASSILRGLLESVDRFRENSEQSDDMTVVIARRLAKPTPSGRPRVKLPGPDRR